MELFSDPAKSSQGRRALPALESTIEEHSYRSAKYLSATVDSLSPVGAVGKCKL